MSLELGQIAFTYPNTSKPVLCNISLRVATGESVAIMGPSGRGKTTLLAVAGLLLSPDEGTVKLDGTEVTTREASQLLGGQITWVLQSVNLLPHRTVIDNIVLPLLSRGWRRKAAEARGTAVLQRVGLPGYENKRASELSGGEAQRVGVARALTTGPWLLLADEPTANLDRETAQVVAHALFSATRDTTLLVTTHDPEVARYADWVFWLGEQNQPGQKASPREKNHPVRGKLLGGEAQLGAQTRCGEDP
ncbi:peptide ABC transporter ATP-binding protein [Actinobaculum suis]|uniref:Peptide ABC transporter ATP-binding protein n=1 Tax=Actinobaculum suis TaxID=1657 RepID=A0A7Z8Y9B5_9ACTO|nr:ABC transporter ATP-binding protein [Actinobaculum suis]VDG76420.1 peptide ABC transporter ATP-binding protein [Actinobaculum suis]